MRKEGPPPANNVSKISLCFETKPLVATLLALTLVMVIWNLQPYYDTILSSSSSTRPCSSSPSPPLTTTSKSLPLKTTTTSLLAQTNTNNKKLNSPNPNNTQQLDPNKRLFSAYGNAAALYVHMGAYRGGPQTFAVMGLASKPLHVYGHPWYKCKWISNNGTTTSAKSYKILPDWGYGRIYTVVVVNCTFDSNPNQDNSGGKLALYAYYGKSQKRYEKVIALEEAPGSYDESKYRPPYEYDYLYCGSSLFGNLSADRMREWMAYHAWFFGERSHFVFHDAGGVSAEVKAVLEPWERAGKVTIQDIRDQEEYDGYYHNQFLVVNDCLHRYRYAANWTFFFDVDEYIYLPEGNTLESVLNEFGVNNTQFTIDQYPMSSMLCLNDSTQDYSREWGFEKLLFKDSRTNIWRDRKYAIQAKNAYATGVHMSENVIGGTLHQTETKIRFYHYHNSINVQEELCRQFLPMTAKDNTTWVNNITYVYDDSMKKLAPTIKEFERSFSVL